MAEWKTGDVITAERLNGMQKEPLIVNATYYSVEDVQGMQLDKTWKEIYDAFILGNTILVHEEDEHNNIYRIVPMVTINDNQYNVYVTSDYSMQYTANSENDYPFYSYN